MYLDERRIDQNVQLDVFLYWKTNQFLYPDLSKMVHDVLAIPIATVASKSAFSTGGRILDQYLSRLKSNVMEALICTRD